MRIASDARAAVCVIVRSSWVALLALAACAPLPSRSVIPSPDELLDRGGDATTFATYETYEHAPRSKRWTLPDPPSFSAFVAANATAEKRRDTVDRIWRTIDDEYYDPSFNGANVAALTARSMHDVETVTSDAEFYRVLKRDVAAIKDSHTTVLTPRQAVQSRTQRATQIGIVLALLEGHVVISEVVPGFPADEQGVRAGMIVDAIDDRSMDAAFLASAAQSVSTSVDIDETTTSSDEKAEAQRRIIAAVRALLVERDGPPRPHRLALRRRDDSAFSVNVQARVGNVPTVERFELRASGIGVLRLSRFDGMKRRELARDLDVARARSRGLILDLRENPGGEVRLFQWLVGRFLDHDLSVGTVTLRDRGEALTYEIPGEYSAAPYTAPLVILTDGRTASAAEWAAYSLVELRGALTVGEPTCGCVVGVRREFLLPDGGVLRVAEVGFHSAQHHRMEGEPLLPFMAVSPTLAQLRAGEDAALVAAERVLLERVATGDIESGRVSARIGASDER
jgi:carboxyl-terminal processing protease